VQRIDAETIANFAVTQTLPPAKAQWLAHFSFESELVRQHQGSLRRCRLKCGSTLIKAKQCKTNKEEIPIHLLVVDHSMA
jgi:hypothetical protein